MALSGPQPHELQLKFVPASSVALHEETDPTRVARIRQALDLDGVLRNPPVVGGSTVLDGATRTTALRELGVRHLLVQEVPYGGADSVELHSWYHVVPPAAARKVLEAVATGKHTDFIAETTSLSEATAELNRFSGGEPSRACAALAVSATDAILLRPSSAAVSTPKILRELVQSYGGSHEIYRIVHEDLVSTVKRAVQSPLIVMFPRFTPEQIEKSAHNADLLPAGITRHIIPGRALNLNVSLHRLLSSTPIEEKNEWLREVIEKKVLEKKVRFYHEPVFVFDD